MNYSALNQPYRIPAHYPKLPLHKNVLNFTALPKLFYTEMQISVLNYTALHYRKLYYRILS